MAYCWDTGTKLIAFWRDREGGHALFRLCAARYRAEHRVRQEQDVVPIR
jgi:hypothetical protein